MAEPILLQPVDYVVTTLMLLFPLGIGVYFAVKDSKNATRDEYLLGGRRMSMLPVALSMFVTFISAIALVGAPSDIYYYSVMTITPFIGFSLSYIVGIYTMIPLIYPLHLTSLYEYLLLRFESDVVRISAVCLGMLQTLSYMGIALLTPALSLQAAAGIPLWMSVAIVGAIGTLYTALGGIKSVVWADAFQCLVMFGGLMAVIVKGSLTVGGGNAVFEAAMAGGRIRFSEIDPDPRTRFSWWSITIGGMFVWFANIFNQSMIQRVSAMKTMREAKISFLLNVPILLSFAAMLAACGIVLYAYFHFLRCDPFEAGLITSRNQLTPYFVLHVLRDLPGMSGLYMATLFSAALSTVSSGINALAAITVEDFFKRPLARISENTATLITKLIVCFYGVCSVGLAYGANSVKGPLTQIGLSIFGACGGPTCGVFFLGALIPWANKYGAFTGGVLGLGLNVWMAIGNQIYGRKIKSLEPPPTDLCHGNLTTTYNDTFTYITTSAMDLSERFPLSSTSPGIPSEKDPYAFGFFLYDISFEWYGLTGCVVSFGVGLIVSLCSRKAVQSKPNPKLIFPFARRLWSLPEPVHTAADEFNSEAVKNMNLSKKKLQEFNNRQFSFVISDAEQDKEVTSLLNTENHNK
ncbi:unnamed protein product [Candidula unifasciata]|uniref:Sodium-coupled monocarboxylate transporter 1 n=1 Tax=Candidula unifasciata TaxID=100452 RepID=A0A8S3Z3G0_9EUPU|nr:unnamed protein product [Candidula unifasciata]